MACQRRLPRSKVRVGDKGLASRAQPSSESLPLGN
jgi:hypothetical protein